MASSYDNSDPGYVVSQADMDAASNRPGIGSLLGANSRFRPSNPNLPPNVSQMWIDSTTGKTYTGMLAANSPNQLIIAPKGNPENTTSVDINTGKMSQAMPHPWLDALKNTAMIWGGPETAGALSGAFGGAGAAGSG